jgi:NAD(P)-dependent dehydrogenase (short-subunit alcohol dehydrogenase family)
MDALKDRVAVITGAGRGMGKEHALLFAQEGATVVVNDWGRSVDAQEPVEDVAQQVTEEIVSTGGQAIADTEDISTFGGARRVIDRAVQTYGRVDVVVNNAVSYSHNSMIADMPEADFDMQSATSLKGTFGMLQAATRHWKARSEGGEQVNAAVVNLTSVSGLFGNVAQGVYGANKAAIAALTIIASRELAGYGIRVNAIAPLARTRLAVEYFTRHPDFDLLRNGLADVFPPRPRGRPGPQCPGPPDTRRHGHGSGCFRAGPHVRAGGVAVHGVMPTHRRDPRGRRARPDRPSRGLDSGRDVRVSRRLVDHRKRG